MSYHHVSVTERTTLYRSVTVEVIAPAPGGGEMQVGKVSVFVQRSSRDDQPKPTLAIDCGTLTREASTLVAEAIPLAWKKWDERFGESKP